MELKTLSNKHLQYKAAGLEEAYHLVYYIPQGDTTTWTARVARFKNRADEEDFQLIKSMTIEAFVNSRLTFDYVIRVLGHNETVPLKSAKIREYVYDIASAIGAKYLSQLLNKTRSTAALHTLPTLLDRQKEIKNVFFIKNRDENLNNKNILIIDDITTSCTTVAEMVRTIKAEWPDAKCYLFCLARTNHEMNANVNL